MICIAKLFRNCNTDRNICEIHSVSIEFTPQNKHFKIAVVLITDCPKANGRAFGNFALKNQTNVKFSNYIIFNNMQLPYERRRTDLIEFTQQNKHLK
ncbi:MAG: hypothetical protein ACOYMA_13360 [Bacteroidia bacterium]